MIARLKLSGVSKRFQAAGGESLVAVQDVSLEVPDGKFLCIVGPSGCGKSTLLDMMAGFTRPDTGEIFKDDKRVEGPGPDRVMVFQEHALFPWLSVFRNVEFGLKHRGIPTEERREKVFAALALVQLADFSDAAIHQLSGGMKQRVALARALVLEPEVLLMDEPFAALDTQTRDLMVEELRAIWSRTASTVVFVTHAVREAVYLGDEVALMTFRPGRIKQVFPVDLRRPRNPDDPKLEALVRLIVEELHTEVEKAMSEELRQLK